MLLRIFQKLVKLDLVWFYYRQILNTTPPLLVKLICGHMMELSEVSRIVTSLFCTLLMDLSVVSGCQQKVVKRSKIRLQMESISSSDVTLSLLMSFIIPNLLHPMKRVNTERSIEGRIKSKSIYLTQDQLELQKKDLLPTVN